ncbi:MAG: hypothetical protein E7773_00975 [Sphingomonas sp.]|uniref:hypothetical protein n=1 Tax=Sphingomonas sp. TaxID=28214 RepID=UPI0011F902CE|nr:hypothetical protein [Sphingomonas sp.]THD38356.1 MAG: hypothetical protein E7773_00975 [Sphingomonas sp.]
MPTIEERDRYARRALELRAMANTVRDADIKQTLNDMIASYDNLVEECDRIVAARPKLDPG